MESSGANASCENNPPSSRNGVNTSKPLVFSHWLGAAHRKNGLGANALIDLQDSSWRLAVMYAYVNGFS